MSLPLNTNISVTVCDLEKRTWLKQVELKYNIIFSKTLAFRSENARSSISPFDRRRFGNATVQVVFALQPQLFLFSGVAAPVVDKRPTDHEHRK